MLARFKNWVCAAHICKGKLSYSVKLFLSKIHIEFRKKDLGSAYLFFAVSKGLERVGRFIK